MTSNDANYPTPDDARDDALASLNERLAAVDASPADIAAGCRCAADGELTEAARAALPEDAEARIAFEHSLRDACARAVVLDATATAPASLAERVRQIAARSAAAADASVEAKPSDDAPAPIPFWTRALPFAAAAVLILAVLTPAVLLGPGMFGGGAPTEAQLVEFLTDQHRTCDADAGKFAKKVSATEMAELEAFFEAKLERSPCLRAVVREGYVLDGAGPCGVPGPGASVHVMFDPSASCQDAQPLSIFIQRASDEDMSKLAERQPIEMDCPEGSPQVLRWRQGDLVFYVVSNPCKSTDKLVNAMCPCPLLDDKTEPHGDENGAG